MITLWGPSSAGKTALLANLILRLPPEESGWQVFETEVSHDEVKAQIRKILRENEFPLATDKTQPRQISFIFKNEKTNAEHMLETTDRAGVDSEDMHQALLQSLTDADGIVLVLDWNRGHRETEVYEALLEMNLKRGAKKDDRPLAVCLSKVDQFIRDTDELRRLHEKRETFVQEKLSDDLLRRIRQYHSNVSYFPISSVGLRLRYGSIQKSVFYDERLLLRATTLGTPLNIVEPFIWIMENMRPPA
jgi:GTPase SAR1 family protein